MRVKTERQNGNKRKAQPQQANACFFTLGYQKKTARSLLHALRINGVQVLIDVRQNPVSRKPGFSKRALETGLSKAGIEYLHIPTLGTPPFIRNYFSRTGNIEHTLERYGAYISSRVYRLEYLLNVVTSRTYCLLCLESDPKSCHRSVLAEKLEKLTKCQVIHLQ